MSWQTLDEFKLRMVFLLAAPKLNQQGYRYVNETQVQDEAEEYMDIVQVDSIYFSDKYFK